jgi:hypothetical protein
VQATSPIDAGEIVAVKGGHIANRATVESLPEEIADSAFPIADDLWLAALTPAEFEGVMMLVNHSCEPNVGMGGNIALVSMRPIDAGEELTMDYAMFLGDPAFEMACTCGAAGCREVVKGTDWQRPDLQARYEGWFAWWLQQKIGSVRPS